MFVFYAFLVSVLICILSLVFLKTYQLEGYKIKKYLKKVKCFEFAWGTKNLLIFTKRIIRLIFCDFLLFFCVFLLFFAFIKIFWINFVLSLCMIVVSPIFVVLAFLIALPIEEFIKRNYLRKAKKKLEKMSCKKIAITGSFGKTSTKNILYQILKEEFDVCATPESYNTPMGICKTVLQDLKETDDFFIVEMGARNSGDIEFLAKFVGVDFGIVTPIGNCHLETFGSLENIENAKYELCKEAKGLVLFNGKSSSTKKLYRRYEQKKYLVCDKNGFSYAKNIKVSNEGSEFVLVLDQKEFFCKTSLLGKTNIDNIVVSATMAYLLGESLFSIKKGIEKLKPIPHRLELIKGAVVNVIDDSYNSNLDGFKQALEVLGGFSGRKIVVSPGLVELGKEQVNSNFTAGKEVAKIADVFVIMNDTNKKALHEGAKVGGMSDEQIYFAKTRAEQKEILRKVIEANGVVLFENDLPDNFR